MPQGACYGGTETHSVRNPPEQRHSDARSVETVGASCLPTSAACASGVVGNGLLVPVRFGPPSTSPRHPPTQGPRTRAGDAQGCVSNYVRISSAVTEGDD